MFMDEIFRKFFFIILVQILEIIYLSHGGRLSQIVVDIGDILDISVRVIEVIAQFNLDHIFECLLNELFFNYAYAVIGILALKLYFYPTFIIDIVIVVVEFFSLADASLFLAEIVCAMAPSS